MIEELKYFNLEFLLEETKFLKQIFTGFRLNEKIAFVYVAYLQTNNVIPLIKTYSLSIRANDALLCTAYLCDFFFCL